MASATGINQSDNFLWQQELMEISGLSPRSGAAKLQNLTIDKQSIRKEGDVVSLQYQADDESQVEVAIGKDKITFSLSVPGYDEPAVQELKFDEIAEWTPEQRANVDELHAAIADSNLMLIDHESTLALDDAKAYLEVLSESSPIDTDDNIEADPIDDSETSVPGERYALESKVIPTPPGGLGLPGGVRVGWMVDVKGDGNSEEVRLQEDGQTGEYRGEEYPIEFDDGGDAYIVMGDPGSDNVDADG